MARLPMVPGDWLADDQSTGEEISAIDDPIHEGKTGIMSDLVDRSLQPPRGTALSWFMEPHEIASIPGLPGYAYQSASITPASYVPNGNTTADPGTSSDRFKEGEAGLDIFDHVKDGWSIGNHLVDKVLQSHMAEQLGDLAEKAGYAVQAAKNGLGAASEISKGAPVGTTLAGAGIKTVSGIGAGAAVGGAIGAMGGGPIGAALGVMAGSWLSDKLLGDNNQRVGEGALRALDGAGRAYSNNVLNNPYYDPRLAAMP